MANITLTIPDAILPDVIDAICNRNGYDPASGLTKAQFAKSKLIDFIKSAYLSEKADQLRKANEDALVTNINNLTSPDIT